MAARFSPSGFFLAGLMAVAMALPGEVATRTIKEHSLERMAERLEARLGMHERLSVSIVDSNKYLVSVRRSPQDSGRFLIEFDKGFLSTLTEQEEQVALAHELGHVWIFTHRPYLQTEGLANEIAMHAIDRVELNDVYEKVWNYRGNPGTLAELLSEVE